MLGPQAPPCRLSRASCDAASRAQRGARLWCAARARERGQRLREPRRAGRAAGRPEHALPTRDALGSKAAQQRAGVRRGGVLQDQQQRAERQPAAQHAVQVGVAGRDQRLAMQPGARARAWRGAAGRPSAAAAVRLRRCASCLCTV